MELNKAISSTLNFKPKFRSNGYQNYSWISPRSVVRAAKRETRFQGVFTLIPPLSWKNRERVHNVRLTMVRNSVNVGAAAIIILSTIFSILLILTSQPQGEIPPESSDVQEIDEGDHVFDAESEERPVEEQVSINRTDDLVGLWEMNGNSHLDIYQSPVSM